MESQAVVAKLGFGSRLSTTFLITNNLTNIWFKMSGIDKSLATTNDVILIKRSWSEVRIRTLWFPKLGRAEPRLYDTLSNATFNKVFRFILLYWIRARVCGYAFNDPQKNFFIVYCKLQSTQLERVISRSEVRKGREAGTIHRWFTGVVLLS